MDYWYPLLFGRGPQAHGKRAEIKVRNILRHEGLCLQRRIGGSTREHDLVLLHEGSEIGIEVKSEKASEGGQKKFQYADGRLIMSDPFFSSLLGSHVPFHGDIPSFVRGDTSFETWLVEKKSFKDEYIDVPDDAVAQYYARKGAAYIYIENKGMFRTGEDVCHMNVPLFRARTRLRIRCKQHGRTSLPGTVMACLVFRIPKV